jgi:ABC-type multidrug transport system fused ATPase/permease subunit
VVQQGAALVDPEAGIAIEQGRLTAVCCAAPDEASLLADRLGRYVDSAVTFGGVPLVELPIDEVRRRVHVVHNDALLFVGPLRRELDPAALSTTTPGLLEEATDVASARDIIEAAPGGFDAMVEEAGRNFSGGERQRLRLVRALMTEPEVLVLVEPTSAVDAHTESRIAQRLRAHRAGRTTVVFTNNPIMLDQADHVAYVEDGRVVTEGAPGNVLSNARFRQLVLRENTS